MVVSTKDEISRLKKQNADSRLLLWAIEEIKNSILYWEMVWLWWVSCKQSSVFSDIVNMQQYISNNFDIWEVETHRKFFNLNGKCPESFDLCTCLSTKFFFKLKSSKLSSLLFSLSILTFSETEKDKYHHKK